MKKNFVTASEFRNRRGKHGGKGRSDGRGEESHLQEACVKWFRLAYPAYRDLLISIPNTAASSQSRGAVLKKEGLSAGASDLFLFVPRTPWHGLAIEMKTPSGVLASHQNDWGVRVMERGYLYQVCRDFRSFQSLVEVYLAS